MLGCAFSAAGATEGCRITAFSAARRQAGPLENLVRFQEYEMASHHIAKLRPADFKKLERISSNLIETLKEFADLCVCEDGDHKFGVPPIICDVHELDILIRQIRSERDNRCGKGRYQKSNK